MRIPTLLRVPRVILWLSLPTLIVLPDVMIAQVGVTTDIITGVVVDATGNPLANVSVEALSLESQEEPLAEDSGAGHRWSTTTSGTRNTYF